MDLDDFNSLFAALSTKGNSVRILFHKPILDNHILAVLRD